MSIILQDIKAVNNKANVFSLVGEDRATVGTDLSALISPPTGERALAIFMPSNTSCGGVQSEKPNLPNLDRDRHLDKLFNLDYYQGMACFIDSHYYPDGDFSTRLDNRKQVGIFNDSKGLQGINRPIRDESADWLKRFGDLRDRREKLADVLFEAGRYKEAQNVRNCGENFIAFKAQCCGDTILHPISCGHRLCPVCMKKRSAKLAVKVEKLILKMRQPKHIVLTVQNVPKIDKAYFSWLRRCFVKLRHRHVFNKCVGGFYSVETTYNNGKMTWHVHIHVIADIPFIPKQELIDDWNKITKGSFIVDIHEIGRDGQSAFEAAKEVAKYIVKPDAFLDDPKLVDEYLKAVKGMRFVSTFGKFYRMALDEEDEGGLPECWCGKNNWVRLDGFYSISDVFKDVQGFYRLKAIISDA